MGCYQCDLNQSNKLNPFIPLGYGGSNLIKSTLKLDSTKSNASIDIHKLYPAI